VQGASEDLCCFGQPGLSVKTDSTEFLFMDFEPVIVFESVSVVELFTTRMAT
jgi:hypothetical protein